MESDNGISGKAMPNRPELQRVLRALRNGEAAGLGDWVEIREGDALETLSDLSGPVDLLFLDGFAPLYLPVLELLKPRLGPGALVVADNLFTFRHQLRDYVAYLREAMEGILGPLAFLALPFVGINVIARKLYTGGRQAVGVAYHLAAVLLLPLFTLVALDELGWWPATGDDLEIATDWISNRQLQVVTALTAALG